MTSLGRKWSLCISQADSSHDIEVKMARASFNSEDWQQRGASSQRISDK
jgi:hypothetical protein